MQEAEEVCTDDEEPSYFVRVTGFSTQTTEDALLNFFENTRRSGGGEIKDYQLRLEEGIADITFCSNKVAERVAQKGNLTLDGANITITLKEIPKELPIDERCLHVMGVSDKTTEDGLISYMEVVSGEEVESIHFENAYHAMVTFKEPPDFDKLLGKCSKKTLDGCLLNIEQVKISDCIEVTGLAPITTKDTIYYYFQNGRNGGGDLKEMEYEKETGRALVFFEDPSVVDSVTKRDHVIDDAHLTVNRYYPFLGETSVARPEIGEKKERIVSVNPQSMLFIEEFFHHEFDQLLQEHCVKYTWQEGSGENVLGCVEPKMDNTTWENSCEAVVSYINQIVTEKINTTQEIWKQIRDKAKEKGVAFENEIQILYTFDFKKKDLSIQLRGKKTSVGVLAKQLQDFISQIEKRILLEKSKIIKKIKLSEAQMDLLSFCGFVEDLKTRHQGLEVTMTNDSNEQAIQLRGQEDEVNEGNVTIWQALSNVKETEIELPKSVISLLGSEAGKVSIATNFKNNNVQAVVGFDTRSDTLIVTAVDRKNLKNAIDLIKEVTAEEGIPVYTNQKQLIGSNKWKEPRHPTQGSMLLQTIEDPESSMLLLAGIKQEVETAKENVEGFFDENLISNKVIDTETGRVKFIFKFNLAAIKDIEDALKKYSVKLMTKSDERSGKVLVSGTRKGIEQAVPKAEMLINNVKDRIVAIDATVLRKLDQGKEWLEFLDGVENKYNCVIERLTEPRSMYDSLNVGPLGSELERVDKLKLQVFAAGTFVIQKIEDEIKAFLEDNKKDAERVFQKQDLKLDGCGLTVTLKEIPKEIPKDPYKLHVMGISEKSTKDGLTSFMEVVSGEEVESMLFGSNSNVMVTFKEPPVVNNVTKKEHIINGAKLKVVPYYPFLGETSTNPGGGKKEKVVKVDPQGLVFIKKFFQQEFDLLLQEHLVNYTWQEGSGEIVLGCVEPKMDKTTWENSCEAVVSYINQIVTEKISVSQEAWKKMYEKAKEECSEFKDRLHITCIEKEHSFTLIGKKPDVSTLLEKLKDLNLEIEKQIIYEKNKFAKNIHRLSEAQFDLLSLSGFVENLRRKFDLEVTMSNKGLAIIFRGPDSLVREGNFRVRQKLFKIKEAEIELPKSIGGIVVSDAGKEFMATQFKKAHIDAVISSDPANPGTQVMVTALDRRAMKRAADLIRDLTSEQSIPLHANQKQLLVTEKWKELKHVIHQSMLLARVTEQPAANALWIAGIKEEVDRAKEKVEKFFEDNGSTAYTAGHRHNIKGSNQYGMGFGNILTTGFFEKKYYKS